MPAANTAFDVFISYSTRHNKLEADAICAKLEQACIRCWVAPRDILHGKDFAAAIMEGLDQCRVMVLVFSEHANQSVHVQREVGQAASLGIPIIPFRVEHTKPTGSLKYYLHSTHWLDAFTPPLEQHIASLIGTLRRLLGENGAPTSLPIQVPTPIRTASPSSEPVGSVPAPVPPEDAPRPGQDFVLSSPSLVLKWIRSGTFIMGSSAEEPARENNEGPQTRVTLTAGFWLGRTQVTQAQWQEVMIENPSRFLGADRPVEQVSWEEAMKFCSELTTQEQAAGRLPVGFRYTLPTEAQWEYACRAGTGGPYAGNLDAMAWYEKNSGSTTHPVAQKQANAWGLHDMHGNVWEWCAGWYADKLPGGSVRDYLGAVSGTNRVGRGGNWVSVAGNCRSAPRYAIEPGLRGSFLGFRLALCAVP